jgi:diaminopimelate epimerase
VVKKIESLHSDKRPDLTTKHSNIKEKIHKNNSLYWSFFIHRFKSQNSKIKREKDNMKTNINIKNSKVTLALEGDNNHIETFQNTIDGKINQKFHAKLTKHFGFLESMNINQQKKYAEDLVLYVIGIIKQLNLSINVEATIEE